MKTVWYEMIEQKARYISQTESNRIYVDMNIFYCF